MEKAALGECGGQFRLGGRWRRPVSALWQAAATDGSRPGSLRARRRPAAVRPVRRGRRCRGCAARRGGERKGKPTAAQPSSSTQNRKVFTMAGFIITSMRMSGIDIQMILMTTYLSKASIFYTMQSFTSNGQSDRGFFWDFTSNVVVLPMPSLESLTCCLCMELVS
ncbi:hypothetical protein EJB05_46937, partial [Eragrostis curvula]